jgi:hypothetical protein
MLPSSMVIQPILGDKILFLFDALVVCPKTGPTCLNPPLICAYHEETEYPLLTTNYP